jgi:hypothetical protein
MERVAGLVDAAEAGHGQGLAQDRSTLTGQYKTR